MGFSETKLAGPPSWLGSLIHLQPACWEPAFFPERQDAPDRSPFGWMCWVGLGCGWLFSQQSCFWTAGTVASYEWPS